MKIKNRCLPINVRSICSRIGQVARVSSVGSIAAVLGWVNIAMAQVTLSPLSIDVQAKGGQAQGVIDIRNTGNTVFRARVYAEPFTYDRDTGFKVLTSSPADLRPYLQFSPQELNLPPGDLRRVRVTIKLPPNQPDGEYRAMIFTEPLTDLSTAKKAGNTTTIVTRIGSALYVRQGNAKPNITVDSAKWNPDTSRVQILVRNSGTASTQNMANWTLSQGGKTIQSAETPMATVLAGADRNLVMDGGATAPALAPGVYQLTGTLTSGREPRQNQSFSFNVNVTGGSKKTAGSISADRP